MKKKVLLLSVIVMLLLTICSFATEEAKISEIYFQKGGNNIIAIENGSIGAKAVLSDAEGKSGSVTFITALYGSDKSICDIAVKSTTFEDCTGEALFPEVNVTDANGAEIKAYMLYGNMQGDYRVLNDSPASLKSVKLKKGNDIYEAEILSAKGEARFNFDVYTLTTKVSTMPDLSGADLLIDGEFEVLENEVNFNKKVTLVAKNKKGPTIKYDVYLNNLVTQKYIDYESYDIGTEVSGKADVVAEKEIGQSGDYVVDRTPTQVLQRPLSGSDEPGEGKAMKITKTASWGCYEQKAAINDYVPENANRIEMSYDLRVDYIDSVSVNGGFEIGRGFCSQYSGAPHGIAVSKSTSYGKPADADYTIAFYQAKTYFPLKNPPSFKYKQWYNIKVVQYLLENDYSYDLYIDGKYVGTEKPALGTGFITPLQKINGTHKVTYMVDKKEYDIRTRIFAIDGMERSNYIAWIDNMDIKFSYTNLDTRPTLYAIGDSLMQTYKTNYAREMQGWGFNIEDSLDTSKMRYLNMATAGHRAQFFVNGSSSHQADWQHIKTQLKDGDYVLFSIGVNDLVSGHADVARFKRDMRVMLYDVVAAGAKIVISSQPPGFVYDNLVMEKRAIVTNALSDLALEYGADYVDLEDAVYTVFQAEVSASSNEAVWAKYYRPEDRTHLNKTGAKFVADKFIELIRNSNSTLKNYLKAN